MENCQLSVFNSRVLVVCLLLPAWVGCPVYAAAPETPPAPRIEAVAGAALQPGQAFAVLPPWFPVPKPLRLPAAGQLQFRPWFPLTPLPPTPHVLASDREHPIRLRPVPDRPEPAGALSGAPPVLPAGALVRAASPDSSSTAAVMAGPVPSRSLPPIRAWLPMISAAYEKAPRRVPTDGSHPLYPRPAIDCPEVASAPTSLAMAPPRVPTEALAFAFAVDPTREPLRSASFLPIPERTTGATDPTLDWARRAAVTYVSWLRLGAAPFLKLSIPDPFEALTVVQLRATWPDTDPPATAPGLPSRRTLPLNP